MKHISLYHRRKRMRMAMRLKPQKKSCMLWKVC
ncbi:hypothetical protein NC653_024500 [Populus alba x Populus x berolinensis]|uniref:Uncharacterized protein n=1 Tax=Populus alba x Populus x berolinensis TaxID=444605 RepID=A0AAD6Q6W0_9ROSI|nr:hypothetical protein NC653_024500 [Populus alba x Populus x berolinensis]